MIDKIVTTRHIPPSFLKMDNVQKHKKNEEAAVVAEDPSAAPPIDFSECCARCSRTFDAPSATPSWIISWNASSFE